VAGYWKAPRVLARLLAERELPLNAYALLNFLAQSGADRPGGIATSNGALADALDVSDVTIRRALRRLRSLDLLDFDRHQGVAVFTVKTTATLAALEGEPRSLLRSPESEVVTDVTSVTPASPPSRNSASAERSRGAATSVPSRVRAETETETFSKKVSVSPPRSAETPPSPPPTLEGASASTARGSQAAGPAGGKPPGQPQRVRCPYPYEPGPCGVECSDEAALADHLLNVHGLRPQDGRR
jgi:Bacterial regulatory proteins, gntR family